MRIRSIIPAVLVCTALVVPTTALAQPGPNSFRHTFPVASRVCGAAANGKVPPKLQSSLDQLTQACTDLQSAFTQAQTDAQTALAGLKQQVTDAKTTARTACQQARQSGDRTACRTALATLRSTLQGLKGQVGQIMSQYRAAVNGARKTFWTTVQSLAGGNGGIKPDSPVKS